MISTASQSILDELLIAEPEWCSSGPGKMTPREVDFIEGLNRNRDKALSPRQKAWLDRIWRKVFS